MTGTPAFSKLAQLRVSTIRFATASLACGLELLMKSAFLSIVVAVAVTLPGSAANAAENFYHDKTIRILTAAAGGSYDAYARLVARYLPTHIDGGVKAVVVRNMPGATIKIPLYLKDVASNDAT